VVAATGVITSRNIICILLTRVLLNERGVDSRICNSPRCRDWLYPTLSPLHLALDAPTSQIKRTGCEPDHSASSNAALKMRSTLPPTPSNARPTQEFAAVVRFRGCMDTVEYLPTVRMLGCHFQITLSTIHHHSSSNFGLLP